MSQMTSGKVLREARERKGYDLNTVARRLRIRPDILRAIESSDFSAMPPRGYTRNMVNAYARLLGLNPTEIVNMYLDEAYANQVERARDSSPSSGFHLERETRQSRSRVGVGSGSVADEPDDEGVTQYTRVLYDDGTRFARDDYGVTRERTNKAGRSDRDFSSHHSGYEQTHFNFLDDRSGVRRGNKNIYAGQTPMQYSASRLPDFLQTRGAIIAIAAIAAVILIAIIVIFVGGNKNEEEDVASLPVSGISDTTGTEDEESSAAVEIAPTSARVTYSVEKGDECYVETYTDGVLNGEQLTGPAEKSVEVTGKWVITTWTPDVLTVKVDGEEVKLAVSQEYQGMYAYTVDFPAILEQWKATHGSGSSARLTASASAASATTTGTTSTGTAGDATSSTVQGQSDQNGYGADGQETGYVDEYGNVVQSDGYGNYYTTDEYGNVTQTDEYGNALYTEDYGYDENADDGSYYDEEQAY